jgi:NADH-quinone oxidoreductase subunit L
LSGFFSKDAVLASTLQSPYWPLFAPLGFAGAFLSAVYVARALRLLWRGEGSGGARVTGARWMGAGMAPLVVLAASLGLALVPLVRLVGGELPEDLLVGAAGVALSAGGLALGWFVPAALLPGPARGAAERGFRLGGGFDTLVARPALALALACARFDDRVVDGAVRAVGRGGLGVARLADLADERGIDGLIRGLVRTTRGLGSRARTLQSGLVHRELLLAVAGAALFFVLLLVGFGAGV